MNANPAAPTPIGVIQLYGMQPPHDCGYCHEKSSSVSYGVTASKMSVRAYESLMLVGWRRSGSYFYKPIMHRTCCPAYTIRLSAEQFLPTKKQRRLTRICKAKVLRSASTSSSSGDSEALDGEEEQAGLEEEMEISLSIERASFSAEKLELYKRYQMAVHGDPAHKCSEEAFCDFLVRSPLIDDVPPAPGDTAAPPPPCGFGTVHQLYRLGNNLIAVGVLDVLPSGLSSVYFFYDPAYKHLSLGKLSAIKEIEFCRTAGLAYYYMGFYIHTCQKMKYKAQYKPSELLCPTSLEWIPLQSCLGALDRFLFSPLRPDLAAQRADVHAACSSSHQGQQTSAGQDRSTAQASSSSSSSLRPGPTETALLEQFAPRFPPGSVPPPESLRLELDSSMVQLRDISFRGRAMLQPLLQEWAQIAGPACSDLVVQLR